MDGWLNGWFEFEGSWVRGDFGDKMAGWFAMTLMALVNLFLSN